MAVVFGIVLALVGFEIGLKTSLFVQALIMVGTIMYLNSWHSRSKEIGSLIDVFFAVVGWAGVAIGDLYFYIMFSDPASHFNLKWLLAP